MKSILKWLYHPSEFATFNEGVSLVFSPYNRLVRILFGWRFINWIFKWFSFGYRVIFGERLFEIPVFWMNFANLSGSIKRVLDFGCCESKISLQLSSLGYEVTGIDLRDYPYKHSMPGFNFIKGDIFENSSDMECFDLIVAISAIEHVGLRVYGGSFQRDDKSLIKIFSQVLNPKGYLFVTVPYGMEYKEIDWLRIHNDASLDRLFSPEFNLLKTNVFTIPKSKHWHGYSEKVWCGLLQKN